jgi:hypothetical protein
VSLWRKKSSKNKNSKQMPLRKDEWEHLALEIAFAKVRLARVLAAILDRTGQAANFPCERSPNARRTENALAEDYNNKDLLALAESIEEELKTNPGVYANEDHACLPLLRFAIEHVKVVTGEMEGVKAVNQITNSKLVFVANTYLNL